MGYELHITRKAFWSDQEGETITLDEWIEYVNSDPEMRLDGYAEARVPDGVLRVESPGLSVWTAYAGHEKSGHGKNGNMAWFDHFNGNIDVKNPDQEIIRKMYQIARSLHAKVQGDDGECYDENGHIIRQQEEPATGVMPKAAIRKWWRFWKQA